uniref:Leucine-rich immune protein (Long) n=1 Tax=Anopheles atroparvus TaxID=41427 RepID=A0A8W7MWW7_ANOAO
MKSDLNRAMGWRETLVLSFLLMCGFIQCKSVRYQHDDSGTFSSVDNGQAQVQREDPVYWDGGQSRHTETYTQSRSLGEKRHHCRESNQDYDCIFQNVFIDNLNNAVLFGHAAQQLNNQSRLTFKNSTIRSLPRSLVDTYTNVELLNLERLQIETIQPFALANGQKIKELFLSYNNIASLDAGVFDYLKSLEKLVMDGNQLAILPVPLFRYTNNLNVVSMAGNNLDRIEDGTFRNNPNLENVNVANNRLTHFDLSFIPRLYEADVKNNLLQELNIPGEIHQLDASRNQIRRVVAQTGNTVEILSLSHNKLNTVGWLKPLKKLQLLDLSFNEIEDITSTDFKQLAKLNTLKLNNNRLFTFTMQSPSSRSLKILDLSHNSLVYMDNNLKPFEQLEELYLDHNSIVNVNLETLRKLSNLSLSHNDWDCAKLANLVSNLPVTTVVDFDTETHCKDNYKLERGICCTASDKPYHDRLIKYIAEVSAYERMNRNNAICSRDTVYDTVKSVNNEIASSGPPASPMLAKEVQDLKSDVQSLELRTGEARRQMSRDADKIDELIRTYRIPKQGLVQPSENLRKVFDHLKDRDSFRVKETAAHEGEKKNKEKEINDLEIENSEMQAALDRMKALRKQKVNETSQKTVEIKKLEAKKNKNLAARKNTK